MNIDNWIQENFRADWIQMNPVPFVTRPIGNEFNFGEFRYRDHDEIISEWLAIDTIGANNSCLIHSILTLSSNVYVRMNRLHKIAVAERFRVYIKDHIRFRASEINDLQKGRLLPDSVGEKIAAYLGYNLVILKAQRDRHRNPIPNIIQTHVEDRRVLVILNKGGVIDRPDSGLHFEAVMRHGELIAQPDFTVAILPIIQELLERPLALPEHPLPNPFAHDRPPKPKSDTFKNMINCMKNKHIDIKHKAKELGLSDIGSKSKLCNLILKHVPRKSLDPPKPAKNAPIDVKPVSDSSKRLCSPMRTKKKSGELSLVDAKHLAKINGLSTKGTKSDICKRLADNNLVRLSGRRSKRFRRNRSRSR